jgi:hypothetical protein
MLASQILKRQRAEEAQARRGLRHKGGRRVSFAPDEELETMHLYQVNNARSAVCLQHKAGPCQQCLVCAM